MQWWHCFTPSYGSTHTSPCCPLLCSTLCAPPLRSSLACSPAPCLSSLSCPWRRSEGLGLAVTWRNLSQTLESGNKMLCFSNVGFVCTGSGCGSRKKSVSQTGRPIIVFFIDSIIHCYYFNLYMSIFTCPVLSGPFPCSWMMKTPSCLRSFNQPWRTFLRGEESLQMREEMHPVVTNFESSLTFSILHSCSSIVGYMPQLPLSRLRTSKHCCIGGLCPFLCGVGGPLSTLHHWRTGGRLLLLVLLPGPLLLPAGGFP